MTADLHTHTLHSDGLTTPSENAALAKQEGVAVLALTDHDTVDGWEEAAGACARAGITFVPGVELSAEWRGISIHVLGYWPDPDHPAFAAECARLRDERGHRAELMVARMQAEGLDISMERVRAIAGDAPIGRPHVASAMVESGAVPDHESAFRDWIGEHGRAYAPKHALHPADAVRLLRDAGGVAVLAHPGAGRTSNGEDPGVDLDLVDEMVAAGLAGLEADAAGHNVAVADRWRQHAEARHLVVTGSSDFHGRHPDARIGCRTTTPAAFTRLAEAAAAAAGQ
jgi:predicted metal-dependent phosphoesterase TrpH